MQRSVPDASQPKPPFSTSSFPTAARLTHKSQAIPFLHPCAASHPPSAAGTYRPPALLQSLPQQVARVFLGQGRHHLVSRPPSSATSPPISRPSAPLPGRPPHGRGGHPRAPASVRARARGGGRPSHGPPRVHLAAGGTLAPGVPAGAEDGVAQRRAPSPSPAGCATRPASCCSGPPTIQYGKNPALPAPPGASLQGVRPAATALFETTQHTTGEHYNGAASLDPAPVSNAAAFFISLCE
jgi:hypothetical protein